MIDDVRRKGHVSLSTALRTLNAMRDFADIDRVASDADKQHDAPEGRADDRFGAVRSTSRSIGPAGIGRPAARTPAPRSKPVRSRRGILLFDVCIARFISPRPSTPTPGHRACRRGTRTGQSSVALIVCRCSSELEHDFADLDRVSEQRDQRASLLTFDRVGGSALSCRWELAR